MHRPNRCRWSLRRHSHRPPARRRAWDFTLSLNGIIITSLAEGRQRLYHSGKQALVPGGRPIQNVAVLPVVVDASAIVRGDWFLETPPWRVLLDRSRRRQLSLVVPEVVIREVVGRYAEEVENSATLFRQTEGRLLALRALIVRPELEEADSVVARYDSTLRSTLQAARVKTPLPTGIDMMTVVDRAIARRRPFDSSGSGFRDHLIWEAVVDAARSTLILSTSFITKDKRAFYDPGNAPVLAGELVDDLRERGLAPERFRIFQGIREFLVADGVTDPVLELAVTGLVEREFDQWATVCEKWRTASRLPPTKVRTSSWMSSFKLRR